MIFAHCLSLYQNKFVSMALATINCEAIEAKHSQLGLNPRSDTSCYSPDSVAIDIVELMRPKSE